MKPSTNLATRLGSFGLCTSPISSRLAVHRILSHNIASCRSVSYAPSINRPATSRQARVKPVHIYQHQLQTTTIRRSSAMPSAKFSPGSEGPATEAALTNLLSEGAGRWTLTTDGQGIERNFKFKTFTKTWDFMTAVSLQCKIKNHHPEWSNVYNTTFIRWTTHSPRSLSTKDIELASICDALAKDFGEIVDDAPAKKQEETTTTSTTSTTLEKPAGLVGLENLANEAVLASGGDCGCGPKK